MEVYQAAVHTAAGYAIGGVLGVLVVGIVTLANGYRRALPQIGRGRPGE